jgi:uncharacterized protein (TIGR01777 family)
MKILVSGSTGLVGSALTSSLIAKGHTVTPLIRSKSSSGKQGLRWNPDAGIVSPKDFEGFDIMIHLAGESIASGRWSAEQKKKILDSRVKGTTLLSKTISVLQNPPRVFICASAIGIYGDRGDEILDENSKPGTGFLADVCQEWEDSTRLAEKAATRLVKMRFGMILSANGGGLAKMLTPFKMGVGGVVGSGKQYMSWIALDDAVGAINYAIATDSLSGPVNVVSPNPATNQEFTKTLGKVLSRPTIFPVPAFAARIAFGQMADELLLASQRVIPKRLADVGFAFQYPELEGALRHLLNK